MRNFLLTILLAVTTFTLTAQNREKAFEINEKLSRGVNFGNMFEAPSETAWGNPWKPQYAGIIADLGFNHVRIPTRWEPEERSDAEAPYTIKPVFLNRIKQVVDSALNNGLYATINMHHHEALFEDPEGQKDRFLAQWKQISEFFADYPDSLLFELLNEPHGNITATVWNTLLVDGLNTIREDNPDRVVLIGTAEYGGLDGLSELELPDDENIILTIHYYNPFQFTHQGAEWNEGSDDWLGTEWKDSETERQVIQNEMAPLKVLEQEKNIPINIGEFGAYNKADDDSRERWTTYMARYIESQGWSWAYWEFCAGFGFYDKSTGEYIQYLVDALLHNEMPEPARYVGTPVYTSDFAQDISDWSLNNNGGAVSSKQSNGANLEIDISTAGTQGWHIQFVKGDIQLEAGKKYRLSFKAKAASQREGSAYVGMSTSPWTAYSGYNGFTLSDTFAVYTYVFDATVSDNTARIAFDFGLSTPNISFEYVTLESIVLEQPTSAETIKDVKTKVYPNPAQNQLFIDNQDDFRELLICNVHGRLVLQEKINSYSHTTDISRLPSGMYFVTLSKQNYRHTIKIIKN